MDALFQIAQPANAKPGNILTSPPLAALAIAAFGIGTSEFIIMGLLPNLADSFQVSIPKAGALFSGYTLANVLGVPAGTALGQAFGWRASFWAIVPIGFLAAAALFWFVPHQPAGSGSLIHEFRVLRRPQVLLVLAMSVLTSASLFCVFTYIAPTLLAVTRVSPHAVTLTLLLFGIGITVGNFVGGTLSDWRPMAFLVAALLTLIVSLIALYFAEPYVIPAVTMILIWGAIQFAAGAPLQSRIVDQASAAPNLASTLNQGAFNLGNATGASLGGMMIAAGFGYRQLPIASAIVTFITLALALVSAKLDRKHRDAHIAEELSAL